MNVWPYLLGFYMNKIRKIISNLALIYLVSLFFFIWGMAVAKYKVFPWKHINSIYLELDSYFNTKDVITKPIKDKILLDHQEYPSKFNFSGFQVRDHDFPDTGYLLISEYSKNWGQVIVKLFSISEGAVIYTWIPPLSEIFKKATGDPGEFQTKATYPAQHPLLLEDGGLIFGSGEGPLVRIDACGSLTWLINRHFHHSIEIDHLGNLVVPVMMKNKNTKLPLDIRDDGFAIVSLNGKILEEYSVAEILLLNGYQGLIYGVGEMETDRIHLNDAQPILQNLVGSNIGDVALSSRHLSTVLLVQPKTKKIKWLKTGPWLAQHDINILDDGKFSIFGNDIIRIPKNPGVFIEDKDISNVYKYDPQNNSVERPYYEMMLKEQIASSTQGRSKILSNDDVFIEETNKGRLIRISKDKVRWEYISSISPTTFGALHWSRYIPQNKINLKWMEKLACN